MGDEQGLICATCGRQTLHRRAQSVNHILHFLAAFFTCGLWLIVWVGLALSASGEPYRCTICGTPWRPLPPPA